jgi:hypothetical protein
MITDGCWTVLAVVSPSTVAVTHGEAVRGDLLRFGWNVELI